jgi:hypothetical protein
MVKLHPSFKGLILAKSIDSMAAEKYSPRKTLDKK